MGTVPNNVTVKGCSTSGCGCTTTTNNFVTTTTCTTTRPELWGSGRVHEIFNLTGKTGVTLADMEITDHANCGWSSRLNDCGAWDANEDSAQVGIRQTGGGGNTFTNLDVHGLRERGFYGASTGNDTFTNVNVRYNSAAGIDYDSCSNAGTCGVTSGNTMTFTNLNLEWNGCVEDWQVDGTVISQGCHSSYGDGLGTSNTSGVWTFTGGSVSHNTSDGLDFLYLNKGSTSGGSVTVKRLRIEGNAGNQLKAPNNIYVEDSLIIGNCGFFSGKSYTDSVEITNCRASGNVLVIAWRDNSSVEPKIYNTTLTSNGTATLLLEGPATETCPVGSQIHLNNSLLLGGRRFNSTTQSTEVWYNSATGDFAKTCAPEVRISNTACTGDYSSNGNCSVTNTSTNYKRTSVTNNAFNSTPSTVFTGTINQGPTTFYSGTDYINQLTIKNTGIAFNRADETVVGTDAVDFYNSNRGVAWDSGGFEFGTQGQVGEAASCSAQTISNCDLVLTVSGSSNGTCSTGYTGACSYSCLDGAWTLSSNTCVIQDCGNAQIDAGEECDGALLNGATCASQGYSSCAGTPSCTNCLLVQGTCAAYAIGNDCLDPGEQCEDGNTTNKDGCSSLGETENSLYQHFVADYTETDVPTTMSVRTHTAQMNGITHAADSSLKRDFTAGFFGDFVHRFKVQIDSCDDNGAGEDGGAAVWAMSAGSYGDLTEMETADDGIALKIKCFSSVARNTWELIEFE